MHRANFGGESVIAFAGVIVGALIMIFSLVVLFDIGRWSTIRNIIPMSWRVLLGILWLLMGVGFALIGVRYSFIQFASMLGVIGSVIYIYYLKRARQQQE